MTPERSTAGMILLDKPVGMTSHDAVDWLRRRLGVRRVGHAGTLDPLASGLLPLLVGPATRLVAMLHGWPKTYVGLIELGRETATGDLEGAAAAAPLAPLPPLAVLRALEEQLTGRRLQRPPVYSAKKIGGVPAHRLARRGRAPELPPRPVTVFRLRLTPRPPGRLAFAARVSSGTYLRSLARDIGRMVGVGGCLASLRRTGIGPLRVRAALAPRPELDGPAIRAALTPPELIPLPIPSVAVSAAGAALFVRGRTIDGSPVVVGLVRVLDGARLLGLGEVAGDGGLRPRVVLAAGMPPPGPDLEPEWRLAAPGGRG